MLSARSICPNCGKKIVWHDNIPILSFLFLLGKCRNCRGNISWQYPLVEAAMMLVFLLVGTVHKEFSLFLVRDLLAAVILFFVFIYDFKHKQIPDFSTIWPAVLFFLINGLFLPWKFGNDIFSAVANYSLAMLIGGGFFCAQYFISKGKWIGVGDILLGIFLGAALGWPNIALCLFLSYLAGGAFGATLLIFKKKKRTDEIAFGAFLSFFGLVCLLFGPSLLSWYMNFLGFKL